MPRLATRTQDFLTFQVMNLFKQAQALQAAGEDIISMGIGEPDFTAPPAVVAALDRASRSGLSGYTAAAGIAPLREAIAAFYGKQFGAAIDPARVIVTAGASGALSLACAALVDPGAEVLMPDPSYPANSNFILGAGGRPRLVASSAEKRFQLSADDVRTHWTDATRGVLIASPSNPTGTSIAHDELSELLHVVRERDGFTIMDEIYLGLSYDHAPKSALTLDDDLIIINSFSKYFHMTGWRLGWLIVPETMVSTIDKIAGSLSICAPTLAQHAALACFEPESMAIFEERRRAFQTRRDYLLPAFEKLGLTVPVKPDGAFYIYADVSSTGMDSQTFSQRLLLETGIAAVPGHDFGPAHARKMMRFSYATALPRLEEAVDRMDRWLKRIKG